jgi:hypothetical protein
MCANPRCRHVLTLELHHIDWVRDGGGNEPSNLIALCPNCHALHTAGHWPKEAIHVWKAMLLSLNNSNRNNVDMLLHLYRMANDSTGSTIRYSGDSLIHLAGLLNAGLIEIGSGISSSGGAGHPPFSSFKLELTPNGLALVEAWLKGDEHRHAAALSRRS